MANFLADPEHVSKTLGIPYRVHSGYAPVQDRVLLRMDSEVKSASDYLDIPYNIFQLMEKLRQMEKSLKETE